MIRLDDMETFVWAVESLSFSETAYQLNISLRLASAAVQRLEKMLKMATTLGRSRAPWFACRLIVGCFATD